MDNLFIFLLLTSLVCLIVGLIRPAIFSRVIKGEITRKKIGLIFGGAFIIFLILFGIIKSEEKTIKDKKNNLQSEEKSEKDNGDKIGTCIGYNCLSDTKLKEIDTDEDGLTDWEELNIYNTSPYLVDTDDDGISDREEINAGTCPNCAEGTSSDTSEISSDLDVNIEDEINSFNEGISVPEGNITRLEEALSGNMSVESLRILMLESGVEKDLVDSFSDEELNTIYQNTLETEKKINKATLGEKNALKTALGYLNYTSFSYSGLVKQLEYEDYTHKEAVYGADNCGADWNEQAALKAEDYMNYSAFSRNGLISQLEHEGFTPQQAEHGVEAVGY